MENIKQEIVKNKFVENLRTIGEFDQHEYECLNKALCKLQVALKGVECIDKELALYLYCIPMMVRNEFENCKTKFGNQEGVNALEDAWVDLDALVLECLADSNA